MSRPTYQTYSLLICNTVVRLILGLLNAYALTRVAKSLEKAFGKTEARVWVGFVGTGFHVVWWAGRTVPNMVAMVGGESRAERASEAKVAE